MTSCTDTLSKANQPLMSQRLAIIILTAMPVLSAWAGPRIQEVPVISSYPVYNTVVREEPRQECHIEQVARRSDGGKSATPAIVGTIVGGALGNAVGSKNRTNAWTLWSVVCSATPLGVTSLDAMLTHTQTCGMRKEKFAVRFMNGLKRSVCLVKT